jgi:hypothetical protein
VAFEGLDPGGRLGAGLAGAGAFPGAGDVNHDGLDDVVMGAPYHDEGGPAVGRTLVRTSADLSASWSNFGTGTPGGGGVPFLQLGAAPVIGETTAVLMDPVSTGPVLSWIHLGVVQTALPVKGGTLYLHPLNSLPLLLHPGQIAFELAVPDGAGLALGPPLLLQLTVPDPFAPQGWAFSKLLIIAFGY